MLALQVLAKPAFDTIMDDWPEYLPRFEAVAAERRAMNMSKSQRAAERQSGAGGGLQRTGSGPEIAYAARRMRGKGGAAFKKAGKAVLASQRFRTLLSPSGGSSKQPVTLPDSGSSASDGSGVSVDQAESPSDSGSTASGAAGADVGGRDGGSAHPRSNSAALFHAAKEAAPSRKQAAAQG
jgi:hypothetical protein